MFKGNILVNIPSFFSVINPKSKKKIKQANKQKTSPPNFFFLKMSRKQEPTSDFSMLDDLLQTSQAAASMAEAFI